MLYSLRHLHFPSASHAFNTNIIVIFPTFLGSALPLYTSMWVSGLVSTDYTKVNATSTEARLAPFIVYTLPSTALR